MPFVTEQEYDLLLARSEKLTEVAADIEVIKQSVSGLVQRFNLQDLLEDGKEAGKTSLMSRMPSKMKMMSRMGGVLSEVMMPGDSLDDLFPKEFIEVLTKYAK